MKQLLYLALFCLLNVASFAQDYPARGGKGTVTIILEPAGSTVYLDGEEIGKSPIKNLPFRSGRHNLLVIDQEQELVNVRFNVWPDKENVFETKTVMPFGNINVTLVGARSCNLTVDGEDGGKLASDSPVLIRNLDAGDHLVKCGNLEKLIKVPGENTVDIEVNYKSREVSVKGAEEIE